MRKVIKKKANLRTNVKTFLAAFFILIIALLLVHIRVLTDNLKYENSKKEQEEKKLLKDREKLKGELEFLRSPSRIEKKALSLGMNYPKNWQIKKIEPR